MSTFGLAAQKGVADDEFMFMIGSCLADLTDSVWLY